MALTETQKMNLAFTRLNTELEDLEYARYPANSVRRLEHLVASIIDSQYPFSEKVQDGLFKLLAAARKILDLWRSSPDASYHGIIIREFNELMYQGGEVLNQMEEELKNRKDQKKGSRCYCGLGGYEGHDPVEWPCNGRGYERGSNLSVNE